MKEKNILAAMALVFSTNLVALDSNALVQNLFFDTNRCLIEGSSHLTLDDDFDSFNLLLADSTIEYNYFSGPGSDASIAVKILRTGQLIKHKTTSYFDMSQKPIQFLSRVSTIEKDRVVEFTLTTASDSEVFKRVGATNSSKLRLQSNKGREVEYGFDGDDIESIRLLVSGVARTEIRKVFESRFGATFSISYFGPTEDENYLYMISVTDNEGLKTLTGHFLLNFNPTMLSTEMIIVDDNFLLFASTSSLTGRGARILQVQKSIDGGSFGVTSPPASYYETNARYIVVSRAKQTF